jgi:hypothetical protein
MGYYACRHNDTIVLNRYDLCGVLNVLARRIGEFRRADVDEGSYYAGAFDALDTLSTFEWRDQAEFFTLFDGLMDALPNGGEVDDGEDNHHTVD